ncbi:MAG: tRNA 5-methoxyuridine(34)/uridine 5-oxyacetic acid(34) synthase CmoB [Gammaproteobacteria bacterium]|jgi:tRNA (mo5U34)-methyltransferase|nr:tRNA 5-methoxyuridine(34)/uridine 5-oxyacetic acid(34) synthase CmoB [Gammaproteobacteria bacterium]MBT3724627.1 tRNA 5-methoxyuridine(34)/uridine 5-oxyacetic acid(34) synthase CmoB [Gammaproteobacteria bacterium]MBT4075986.1 tRNA 5-methoxyuridine(34)/uridine 5-oxyacetic acid(34) synthase CmoB [Gammaproteobacteria bacterium]MBT4194140.1 tRNA 5-methoxyuridine(34)/uridine 5-oxyacetic acid(34) synthase CmoB [Gammaproteobacteria bacterium]MBT4451757.1 tRNA 5-methoxyuridine(34)/uridine 5-oxyaceti
MNYKLLFTQLEQAGFEDWVAELTRLNEKWFDDSHHGDFKRWNEALQMLPEVSVSNIDFSASAITVKGNCESGNKLHEALSLLKPWRKGPFKIADEYIDTEWRSDFKWERVLPHLSSLNKRKILDVGCGNGYHCWRMLNEQPEIVLGIDPSVLFNMQFQALNYYVQDERIHLLPLTIQEMPLNMQWFDTVFSMGILYHRRSPFDHLMQLKGLLKQGGELCLETLVIEGGEGQVLVPESRYARMNNVWFLPSADELVHWLKRCGYKNIRVVDINKTSVQEQRSTEWMPFESLPECLDKEDSNFTVEGYPAPLRAVVLANK